MFARVFKLRTSHQFAVIWLFFIAATLITITTLAISIFLKILLMISVCVYGGMIFWRHILLRAPSSIVWFEWQSDEQWQLYTNTNSFFAHLSDYQFAFTKIVILRFKNPETFWPKSCILFSDSLSADQYRQLLVMLRTN